LDTGVEDRQLAGQASSVATSSQQHAVYGHMPEARKSFIATTMVHMVVTPVYGHSTCLVQAFFLHQIQFLQQRKQYTTNRKDLCDLSLPNQEGEHMHIYAKKRQDAGKS
jgi:hypothetical protein